MTLQKAKEHLREIQEGMIVAENYKKAFHAGMNIISKKVKQLDDMMEKEEQRRQNVIKELKDDL